ncbi:glycosyltransferase family 2 protein [Lysobacter xanthus]
MSTRPVASFDTGTARAMEPGWYLWVAHAKDASRPVPPLMADLGEGFVPLDAATPLFPDARGMLRSVVVFDSAPRALAFAPGRGHAAAIDRVEIRRVGRVRALAELVRGIAAAAPRDRMRVAAWTIASFAHDLLRGGPRHAATRLRGRYVKARNDASSTYAGWLALFDDAARCHQPAGHAQPRFDDAVHVAVGLSVVVVLDRAAPAHVTRLLASIRAQDGGPWDTCIAVREDAPLAVRRALGAIAGSTALRIVVRPPGATAAALFEAAVDAARGSLLALVDASDVLAPAALAALATAHNSHPGAVLFYTDDDIIDEDGRRHSSHLKPDWGPDLWLSRKMLAGLVGVDRACAFRCARQATESLAWRRELLLGILREASPGQVVHLPRVLCHRHDAPAPRGAARDAETRAVERHARVLGFEGHAEPRWPYGHVFRHTTPASRSRVDIIIPTRDQPELLARCVGSLLEGTDYPSIRILIVDNGSRRPETLDLLRCLRTEGRVHVVEAPGPFNFSRLVNRAMASTDAAVACLLNDDVVALSPDWLDDMVAHALRDEVGAVGAMLYFPDGRIQHAGVVTGLRGVAAHVHYGEPRGSSGYHGRAVLAQNYSAVTAACMVFRRARFEEVGGFDERLAVCYNDVDFCLRLRERGYANVWTPRAELLHYESASRGPDDSPAKRRRHRLEQALMLARWNKVLRRDPAYNPQLALDGPGFQLAYPPRR